MDDSKYLKNKNNKLKNEIEGMKKSNKY